MRTFQQLGLQRLRDFITPARHAAETRPPTRNAQKVAFLHPRPQVDFGKRALGEAHVKKFKLECKVPIDFEYEFKAIRPNKAFSVAPLKGIVPASGRLPIAITFTPTTYTTEEAVYELTISEFNSKPITVTIVGSGLPGLVRERLLKAAIGDAPPDTRLLDGEVTRAQMQLNGYTAKDGDAMHAYLRDSRWATSRLRDCRVEGPIQAEPYTEPPPPAEVLLDGVYMPKVISGHGETFYIMNQAQGGWPW